MSLKANELENTAKDPNEEILICLGMERLKVNALTSYLKSKGENTDIILERMYSAENGDLM